MSIFTDSTPTSNPKGGGHGYKRGGVLIHSTRRRSPVRREHPTPDTGMEHTWADRHWTTQRRPLGAKEVPEEVPLRRRVLLPVVQEVDEAHDEVASVRRPRPWLEHKGLDPYRVGPLYSPFDPPGV